MTGEETRAQLEQARMLRLATPADAVDPAVHTPGRVAAYLTAQGWRMVAQRSTWTVWQLGGQWGDPSVLVPTRERDADYAQRLGAALKILADRYGVGELRILADIAGPRLEIARQPDEVAW